MVPQLAVTPLVVDADWVAPEPACDPLPLPEGETFTLWFPPFAVPSAIGLQGWVLFPACTVLDADGGEVASESPRVDWPGVEGVGRAVGRSGGARGTGAESGDAARAASVRRPWPFASNCSTFAEIPAAMI